MSAKRRLTAHCPRRLRRTQRSIKQIHRAIAWIHRFSADGKGVSSTSNNRACPYPEVTGYLIPTLLNWGQHALALRYKDWLVSIQNRDGSWNGPDESTSYPFDTGQIIKGLLSLVDRHPQLKRSILRGCDYILAQQDGSGRLKAPQTPAWRLSSGQSLPEAIHLYALEPILTAGVKWNIPPYIASVQRALHYYLDDPRLTDFATLSHFHAYILESLADLGYDGLALKAMAQLIPFRRPNGFIPAYPDASWTCSVGLLQYALTWYKLNRVREGDLILDYASALQNRSGGFFGSYGPQAEYFPTLEISWAVKYFLDAHYWRIKATSNQRSHALPAQVDRHDVRVLEILSSFGDISHRRVLDIGCGKGRFLILLKSLYPESQLYGIDLADHLFNECSIPAELSVCSMLNIHYPDDYFDCILAVESLEHAVMIERALSEISRVLKPGGTLVIVDKDVKQLGVEKIETWEQWFVPQKLRSMLSKHDILSDYKTLTGKEHGLPAKLFVVWKGTKHSGLPNNAPHSRQTSAHGKSHEAL